MSGGKGARTCIERQNKSTGLWKEPNLASLTVWGRRFSGEEEEEECPEDLGALFDDLCPGTSHTEEDGQLL